jgi:small conductance mechanosensitive channel
MSDAFGALVEFALYLATLIIILQQFGLATITLWIIGSIAVIVVFFSLTLTVRDFIPNFIIGLIIRKKLKAKLGKHVRFGMISGKLEQVGIVASTIRNSDEHYVPHLYTSKYI